MIIIFGSDQVEVLKALNEIIKKNEEAEIVRLERDKLTITDIIVAYESSSLFTQNKIVVIEGLLSTPKSKKREEILTYLKSGGKDDIILVEKKEIETSLIKRLFPSAKLINCQPPSLIFRFLDSLGNLPPSSLVNSFHSLLKQREAEFIFVMCLRQLRILIIAKDLGSRGLSDLPSWQAGRFIRQARFFTLEKLISSYRLLLSFDYKIKTGNSPYDLKRLLDIFFINL